MNESDDDRIQEDGSVINDEQPSASEATDHAQSDHPKSISELLGSIKNEEIKQVLGEMLRGMSVARVYIDARSGVSFFDAGATIGGNMVSGDAHYTTGDSSTTGGRSQKGAIQDIDAIGVDQIAARTVAKIKTVYKPPHTYQKALQILLEKHILILYGQTNWGKWTSALHLLAEIQDKPLLEINPGIEFKALQTYHWAFRRGYVIDTWSPEQTMRLAPFVLKRLGAQLQRQESYLIITIDSRIQLQSSITDLNVVVWNEIPAPDVILSKHLDWYIPDSKRQAAAEIIQHQTVTQLLNSHLLPREIDHLGALVSQVVQGSFNLEEATARFATRVRVRVAEWFASHPNVDDRLFMISVAALNGAVDNMIREANERLQAIVRPSKEKEPEYTTESLFDQTLNDRRVNMVYAHTIDGYEKTEFGHNRVKLIHFDDPQFSPVVLKYVWENYDRLHSVILKWLFELGSSAPYEARIRASAAVGELAKHDFGLVRRDVLLPWANHDHSEARLSAAFALGIPVWEGTLAPQVLGLLHHWSTLRNNWRLSWTAVAAYGWLVGLRFPEIALQDMGVIAQRGDVRLLGILSSSTAALFEMGQHSANHYLRILATLREWAKNTESKALSSTGSFIFLHLALASKTKANPDTDTWPTLIWLAEESDDFHGLIVDLWQGALNQKPTRALALSVFREWCVFVENDDYLFQALTRIVTSIVRKGNRREKERLKFYLQRWGEHPEKGVACARQLLANIS